MDKSNTIKPAMIFCDRMILQRRKPIHVWGICSEDVTITVRLLDQEASTQCCMGKWQVTLPEMEACDNTTMEIFSIHEHLIISEVAIGEVWLAGGQSNMEFWMRYDADRKNACGNPHIRMFDHPKISYEGQLETGDYSNFGFWRTCNEENMDYFTAIGYYFAMQLEKQYHIPIGIVGCNWGGTPACAWMDPEYLKDNQGKAWLDDYEKNIENLDLNSYQKQFMENPENYRGKPFENKMQDAMMFGMTEEELNQMIQSMYAEGSTFTPPVEGPMSEKRPGGLYETMLKKLAPYTIRGVIWYQGENDDQKADIYHVVFKELIHCWRDLWKEELPFLFVQLAPFRYWMEEGRKLFPVLRKEQEWVAKNVPGTWMTTIMDNGLKHDIHPKKKKPVGERLALLARGHVYGEDILCDAPECCEMLVEDGRIVLSFQNVGEGLYLRGENIQALEITVNGSRLQEWEMEIQKDHIVISNKKIRNTDAVRVEFAEMDYCEVNLFSGIGIPVMPFTKSKGAEQIEMMKKIICNPYLPGKEYVPDGEPYIFDDRLYVFGSHDEFGSDNYCTGSYVGWSAPLNDLSDWKYEGVILEKGQDPLDPDGDRQYYAPDVAKGLDGRYYLYYSIEGSHIISVAVADAPAGKYQFYGHVKDQNGHVKDQNGHVLGSSDGDPMQFDPAVLVDDDGRIYLYSGQGMPVPEIDGRKVMGSLVCELETDMLTVKTEQKVLTSREEHCFEENPFFEASSIRKIGNTYYFIYSPLPNVHNLCYATSRYPDREFEYQGVLVSNGGIDSVGPDVQKPEYYWGNNHGSILEMNGELYIFYHRHNNKTSWNRQGCAERLLTKNGKIEQAVMTSMGLRTEPFPFNETYPAYMACILKKKEMDDYVPFQFLQFTEADPYITQDETAEIPYIANMKEGSAAGYRYFHFSGAERKVWVELRGTGEGMLCVSGEAQGMISRIPIQADEEWKKFYGEVQVKSAKDTLYVTYQGTGSVDFLRFGAE